VSSVALPPSDPAAEDAFVSVFRDGRADEDALTEVIGACLDARRLRLAARLVGLIEGEDDDPVLQRARRAAALVVHEGLDAGDVSWSALDEALDELRAARMVRSKGRMRRFLNGVTDRPRRGGRR
jgi:DNA-binding transcriptional ArsR family regulator